MYNRQENYKDNLRIYKANFKVLQFIYAPNENILDLRWKTEFYATINFIVHKIKFIFLLILLPAIILRVLEDSLKSCPNKICVLVPMRGRHRTWCFCENVCYLDVAGPFWMYPTLAKTIDWLPFLWLWKCLHCNSGLDGLEYPPK